MLIQRVEKIGNIANVGLHIGICDGSHHWFQVTISGHFSILRIECQTISLHGNTKSRHNTRTYNMVTVNYVQCSSFLTPLDLIFWGMEKGFALQVFLLLYIFLFSFWVLFNCIMIITHNRVGSTFSLKKKNVCISLTGFYVVLAIFQDKNKQICIALK